MRRETDKGDFVSESALTVLILVLVEYAPRVNKARRDTGVQVCLNPCFSGICAASVSRQGKARPAESLNPCFSGICAARHCN